MPVRYDPNNGMPAVSEATWTRMVEAMVGYPALWDITQELLLACERARIAFRYHALLGPAELLEESITKAIALGLETAKLTGKEGQS
jgi:hypothetical protein